MAGYPVKITLQMILDVEVDGEPDNISGYIQDEVLKCIPGILGDDDDDCAVLIHSVEISEIKP